MIRLAIAAFALLAAPLAAQSPPPATVVVAFDPEGVRPLIVEGMANKEAGRALTAEDPVRIASISKLVMTLAALKLVDEGKVDLDRDVSHYLGWTLRSPYRPDAAITLRALLSHRAGLSDKAGYIIPLGESLQAKLADLAAWRDTRASGEAAFQYANLGSPIVATVLEAASGERYDRLVERLVFAPLGVKACLNWIGCSPDMAARAVTLYRDTGEVARDGAEDLPPNCTIPVAEGRPCNLAAYVPGTNASIFSPQGGVRISMMGLAKIGKALMAGPDAIGISAQRLIQLPNSFAGSKTGAEQFFCHYGLGLQFIEVPGDACDDTLFGNGTSWIGHPGEAYGLVSGLWFNKAGQGFAYFTTEVPPSPGGEDTGNFTPAEKALMARAMRMIAKKP